MGGGVRADEEGCLAPPLLSAEGCVRRNSSIFISGPPPAESASPVRVGGARAWRGPEEIETASESPTPAVSGTVTTDSAAAAAAGAAFIGGGGALVCVPTST